MLFFTIIIAWRISRKMIFIFPYVRGDKSKLPFPTEMECFREGNVWNGLRVKNTWWHRKRKLSYFLRLLGRYRILPVRRQQPAFLLYLRGTFLQIYWSCRSKRIQHAKIGSRVYIPITDVLTNKKWYNYEREYSNIFPLLIYLILFWNCFNECYFCTILEQRFTI